MLQICGISFAILLAASVEPFNTAAIPPELVRLFSLEKYYYTGGQYRETTFHYRLFKPNISKQTRRHPLIVWLHGAGATELNEKDHVGQLKHLLLIFDEPERPDKYPFFLLAMQMKVNHWFIQNGLPQDGKGDEQITVLIEILDDIMQKHPIDPNRIYLTGVSAGGSGCWELALRYPDRFAAVAPLASEFTDTSRVRQFYGIPIWVFHSNRDQKPTPESARRMVAAINKAGGNAHFTEIESTLHDCWIAAFQKYRLLDWLLSQSRGLSSGWPPGYVPWTLNEWAKNSFWALAPLALLTLIVTAAYKEIRRQNTKRQVLQHGKLDSTSTSIDFSDSK